MVMVLASIYNKAASAFVDEFPGAAAFLLTCSSLARSESLICFPEIGKSFITINDRRLYLTSIKGIINLLPWVNPEELYFFNESEYLYQAQEFNALFTFLFSVLNVQVLNRPGLQLGLPILNDVSWYHIAAELKIPQIVNNIDSDVPPDFHLYENNLSSVTYLEGTIMPDHGSMKSMSTRMIAHQIKVPYLKAYFTLDTSLFVTASTIPDVTDQRVKDYLFPYFN